MERCPLAVIIPTFNEEANIRLAIESVLDWAQEIYVVDSYSTDRTIDIAMEVGGGRVGIVQHTFESYSAQWNWSLSHLPIGQPWVMKLDADERATPELRKEVTARLTDPQNEFNAFVVHWQLVFQRRKLNWGGLFPNGNFRIWKHGMFQFDNRGVNEHLVVHERAGEIRSPLEHHDYKSLSAWIDRHNRYSSLEAIKIENGNVTGEVVPRLFGTPDQRRMWLRNLYFSVPGRAFCYFLYRYVFRLGMLDGWAGFRYSFLHAAYLYWIDLKRLEYRQTGTKPEVVWPSRGTPHPRIQNSPLQEFVERRETEFIPNAA